MPASSQFKKKEMKKKEKGKRKHGLEKTRPRSSVALVMVVTSLMLLNILLPRHRPVTGRDGATPCSATDTDGPSIFSPLAGLLRSAGQLQGVGRLASPADQMNRGFELGSRK